MVLFQAPGYWDDAVWLCWLQAALMYEMLRRGFFPALSV